MHKSAAKHGVGQLVLQIAFPEGEASHAAGETEDNGPQTSSAPVALGSSKQRKRKWYSLYDKVYALQNLWAAWIKVKANGGAPGIDRMSIARFNDDPVGRLEQLSADLRNKTYRSQPVRRVFIPKAGGGQRPLGIPSVRDRIVQQALLQVLERIFEAKFSNRSHGFRPDRGCQTALDVVDRAVKAKYEWVVDADIKAFFDTVDHAKLVAALNEEIADGSVLDLIGRILKAGVVHPSVGDVEPTELGTPQGGPLSPLLANVYLHRFDEQMAAAGYGLVRYADDFVIFAKSEEAARAALGLASEVLEGSLGLTLHPEKTRVVSVTEGFEFLGFHYFGDPKTGGLAKEVRRKSVQRFRETVRARTPRLKTQRRVKARKITLLLLRKNERVQEIIASVNGHLRGWHAYFRTVWSRYPETPFRDFDSFVRSRIRQAITGRVGHGWWDTRLNNQVLKALGLVSLDHLQRRYTSGLLAASARKG
jgi:RNA-directed DNA polymerase